MLEELVSSRLSRGCEEETLMSEGVKVKAE